VTGGVTRLDRGATPTGPAGARVWWRAIEPLHAVTYFAPECIEAIRDTGLRGFWMGYFGARAAPLGAVTAPVVAATFFNFHASMVERAIPDAWSFATESSILSARRAGAAAALRRLEPEVERRAPALVPWLDRVIAAADGSGRALFSANRRLEPGEDPVERLWQACTSLREHRGDGHVAALTTAGLDGCEALVLFAASEALSGPLFRQSRGWSDDEWEAAERRLTARGLLADGGITPAGRALRRGVEETTDRLAGAPFEALGADEQACLLTGLQELSGSVLDTSVIPFPNPIGLPSP
jgi:hypothetical protein